MPLHQHAAVAEHKKACAGKKDAEYTFGEEGQGII